MQQALHGSSLTESDDNRGAFSTIADAVASAGNAIGQLSSQILGGGEVRPAASTCRISAWLACVCVCVCVTKGLCHVQIQGQVADEEAGLRAEEAVQPLRDWQQGRQSTQGSTGSTYTQQEQQTGPQGYFSQESKAAQDAGPGNEVSASQYTSEAGNWTTGDTGNQAAHSYQRQTSDQGRRAQESQTNQSTMQTFDNQSVSLTLIVPSAFHDPGQSVCSPQTACNPKCIAKGQDQHPQAHDDTECLRMVGCRTCPFQPGCLMSHNWLHTPNCKVSNEMNMKDCMNQG